MSKEKTTYQESELKIMFPNYDLRLERVARVGATYSAYSKDNKAYFLKVLLPKNLHDKNMLLQFPPDIGKIV